MAKSHVVRLTITNESGHPLIYSGAWFDSGRLADHESWPTPIKNGDHQRIEMYERDWATAGCSGYGQYTLNGVTVTIAFSNPSAGSCKLGVGLSGKGVWENMEGHDYKPFVQEFTIGGVKYYANCQCTGGDVNLATVKIAPAN